MKNMHTKSLAALTALLLAWSPLQATGVEKISILSEHDETLTTLQFDSTGTNLLSCDSKGNVKSWGVWTGNKSPNMKERHKGARLVAYSADGTSYVATGRRGQLSIYDLATNDKIKKLVGAPVEQTSLAVSSDGRYIAVGGRDNSVTIYALPMETPIEVLPGHSAPITAIEFSPDGSLVVTAGEDGAINVWEIETAYLVETYEPGTPVYDITMAPDGSRIAAAGEDNITIWNLRTNTLELTLHGHEGDVNSVAFSPNGRFLVSGANDGTTKLWATATGRLLNSVDDLSGGIGNVVFNPNGTMVAVSSKPVKSEEGVVGSSQIALYDISQEYTDGRLVAFVEKQLYHWQKKGEFEKQAEYASRMQSINRKTGQFFTKAYEQMSDEIAEEVTISDYDSEKEEFVITLPTLGALNVQVPIEQAKAFKQDFHKAVFRNFVVKPAISLPMKSTFEVKSLEIYIPSLQESFHYGSSFVSQPTAPSITIQEDGFWER